jgi:Type ISP C-terminal specificity domain
LLYKFDDFIDRPGTISRIFERHPGIVCLLTMDTRTTAGPVVIASDALPGYNSFRGSYETHCFPLVGPSDADQLPGFAPDTLPDALTPGARGWANSLGASTEDVASYMLALGDAPSYQRTFAEALEADIVRFPAITDQQLFPRRCDRGRETIAGLEAPKSAGGSWTQAATGTQLGEAQLFGDHVVFANGDRLSGLHPRSAEFEVSGYPVMERFLQARSHLELSTSLGLATRKLAGAIAAILDEQQTCDDLLTRAIQAPATSW